MDKRISYGPERDAMRDARITNARAELSLPIDPDWFHKMPIDDQKALVRAGWKGNEIKPQVAAGQLVAIDSPRDKSGRVATTYHGDVEAFLGPFKTPVRHRIVAFASGDEPASAVYKRRCDLLKSQADARDLAAYRAK